MKKKPWQKRRGALSRSKSRRSERRTRPLSPRETHGTRVQFHLTCSRCGSPDTLPFVPRTRGELLCRRCAEEIFGKDWAHGRPLDERSEYPIVCARCGREGTVPFQPAEGEEVLCAACYRGEEQPQTDRLSGMKKIVR